MGECINFYISFRGKICNSISLYRSPSQSHVVFETFADTLELNLDTIANRNSYLIVIHEGSKIYTINYTEIYTEIRLPARSNISSQPNFVMELGVPFFAS